jgi:hypothetical protein
MLLSIEHNCRRQGCRQDPCPLTWAMPRGPTGTTILPWGHSLSTSDLGSSSAAAPTWMAW